MADMRRQEGSVPVPDPTLLTTQSLLREINNLRELVDSWLNDIRHEIDALRATVLRLRADDHERTAIQLRERDIRLEQMTRGNEVSLAAALASQKELYDKQNMANTVATAKSEAAFTKQIDQLTMLLHAATKATDDKIADLKERAQLSEGAHKGAGDLWGFIIGAVGLVAAVISIVVLLTRTPH